MGTEDVDDGGDEWFVSPLNTRRPAASDSAPSAEVLGALGDIAERTAPRRSFRAAAKLKLVQLFTLACLFIPAPHSAHASSADRFPGGGGNVAEVVNLKDCHIPQDGHSEEERVWSQQPSVVSWHNAIRPAQASLPPHEQEKLYLANQGQLEDAAWRPAESPKTTGTAIVATMAVRGVMIATASMGSIYALYKLGSAFLSAPVPVPPTVVAGDKHGTLAVPPTPAPAAEEEEEEEEAVLTPPSPQTGSADTTLGASRIVAFYSAAGLVSLWASHVLEARSKSTPPPLASSSSSSSSTSPSSSSLFFAASTSSAVTTTTTTASSSSSPPAATEASSKEESKTHVAKLSEMGYNLFFSPLPTVIKAGVVTNSESETTAAPPPTSPAAPAAPAAPATSGTSGTSEAPETSTPGEHLAEEEDLLLHLEEEEEGLIKAKAVKEVKEVGAERNLSAQRDDATPEDTAEATPKTKMGSEDKMWAEMLAYTEEEESIFLRVQKEATAAVRDEKSKTHVAKLSEMGYNVFFSPLSTAIKVEEKSNNVNNKGNNVFFSPQPPVNRPQVNKNAGGRGGGGAGADQYAAVTVCVEKEAMVFQQDQGEDSDLQVGVGQEGGRVVLARVGQAEPGSKSRGIGRRPDPKFLDGPEALTLLR